MRSIWGRVLLVLVIIIAVAVTWTNVNWRQLEQFTNKPSESRIDYYLTHFTLTTTDANGNVTSRMRGDNIVHKQLSGNTEIYAPVVKMYDSDNNLTTLTSERAIQETKNGTIRLTGSVLVDKRAEPVEAAFTLRTENLIYDPVEQHMHSKADLVFESAQGILTGTGFDSSLKEQELRIHANVRSEFTPTN